MSATASFACNTYSYTLSHDAKSCLAHLADHGFREFELMIYPGHFWPAAATAGETAALRRFAEQSGLRIVSLNMPNIDVNIAGASSEMRRYSLDLLSGVVTLAGELGVAGVVIGPGKANPLFPAPRQRLIEHFYAALDVLVPLARKVGTDVWVENMPFAFLPEINEVTEALERYGNDEIGVVYDVANGHFIQEMPAEALRRCRTRLKLVHLSDTGHDTYRHDPVGMGTVPFDVIPAVLEEIGWRHSPVLEIISQQPDRDILLSVEKLTALGYGRSPARNAAT
jgi:sugar phosphate isomerase/epimerase